MLSLEMIYDAKKVLSDVANETPLLKSKFINPNEEIYIKCENMQVTGSFKLRGAYFKMANLTEDEKKCGVIACSAGNHAQGVALAGQQGGVETVICMPSGAPLAKIEATKSYGAEVVLVSGVYDDAAAYAVELQKEKGYTFLHPFNDPYVMAGQGTIGLEILDQLEDVDIVLVPIGGGGLISGISYAIKQIKPNCKVYGVQAEGAASMLESFEKGKVSKLAQVRTVADGIAVKEPGDLSFEISKEYVDGIVTVSEDEIAATILFLMEKHKMVAEGAGSVSVAAALYKKVPMEGKKTVCVLSGGNVDINILHRIIDKGLQVTGRLTKFTVTMLDTPGQLEKFSTIVAKDGGNIFSINHDRTAKDVAVGDCLVYITIETRDRQHSLDFKEKLELNGFRVTM